MDQVFEDTWWKLNYSPNLQLKQTILKSYRCICPISSPEKEPNEAQNSRI